jgi:hypothetical protein
LAQLNAVQQLFTQITTAHWSMLLLDLHDDVLADVLEAWGNSSLQAFSRTSRRFSLLAIPYIMHTVRLNRDHTQVISFLNYIIRNTKSGGDVDRNVGPGIYVKILAIELDTFNIADKPHTWSRILTRALSLLPNLRIFTLNLYVDRIAAISPDFATTLMSRPYLQEIELYDVDKYAAEQLWDAVKGADAALEIRRVRFSLKDHELVLGEGMGNVLSRFKDTLIEIGGRETVLHGLLNGKRKVIRSAEIATAGGPSPSALIFSKVTTLQVDGSGTSITTLAYAFPQLRVLNLSASFLTDEHTPHEARTLFPKLSSVQGNDSEVTSFLGSQGPHLNLRRIVINDAWNYIPRAEGTIPDPVTTAAPNLTSFHLKLWGELAPPRWWWEDLVGSAPKMTFLSASVPAFNGSDLELAVSIMRPVLDF